MSDTKMLQTLIDGQISIRGDIKKVENNLSKEIRKNGKRIDKLGKQLAYLEDDSPIIEEFDKLGKRVKNLEKSASSN